MCTHPCFSRSIDLLARRVSRRLEGLLVGLLGPLGVRLLGRGGGGWLRSGVNGAHGRGGRCREVRHAEMSAKRKSETGSESPEG